MYLDKWIKIYFYTRTVLQNNMSYCDTMAIGYLTLSPPCNIIFMFVKLSYIMYMRPMFVTVIFIYILYSHLFTVLAQN